ncbi:MAG TPA: lipoyl domain-containing protein [Candidatus Solibacter sp.]|nr:lipoyl domain-containing protein [Candidatus Solibacter sp.]
MPTAAGRLYSSNRIAQGSAAGKEIAISITELRVPKTGGMNTSKVSVVRWLKRVGDRIEKGEPVVELETEKVSYELDSPVGGTLLKILAQEKAEVPIGDPLCEIE